MLPTLRKPDELAPLIEWLWPGAVMAEIGVFSGEGTRQFLARVGKIYCVDSWEGRYDLGDLASDSDMKEAEAEFDRIKDPRAVKVKKTSAAAASLVPNDLDFVYIDADHRYDSVVADLRLWLPKIETGGLIGGHDYGCKYHPGVQRAVDEMLGVPDRVFPDQSWIKRI
jgi:predicted O-methyltransferase YrrM